VAVPKKRKTSCRGKQGRSHDALKSVSLSKCARCGETVAPHTACGFCGYYGDKKVLNVESLVDKKARKEAKKAEKVESES
jgi:large subunit ribosomal protein L32